MEFYIALEHRAVFEPGHGFGDFHQIIGGFHRNGIWRWYMEVVES
jgi:hypothetical protein